MMRIAGDRVAVENTLSTAVAAWDANDADAFADLHAVDATMVYPGSLTRGREKIRAYMAGGFAAGLMGTKAKQDVLAVRFITDDVAIVNSMGGPVLPGETEVCGDLNRRATWVLTRVAGDWRIESCHNG